VKPVLSSREALPGLEPTRQGEAPVEDIEPIRDEIDRRALGLLDVFG
jgi:hypothetical protein